MPNESLAMMDDWDCPCAHILRLDSILVLQIHSVWHYKVIMLQCWYCQQLPIDEPSVDWMDRSRQQTSLSNYQESHGSSTNSSRSVSHCSHSQNAHHKDHSAKWSLSHHGLANQIPIVTYPTPTWLFPSLPDCPFFPLALFGGSGGCHDCCCNCCKKRKTILDGGPWPFMVDRSIVAKRDSVEVKEEQRGKKWQKNNTRDSNVVPHRSTNLARRCLTSLSRREAVLSSWYGRSCLYCRSCKLQTHPNIQLSHFPFYILPNKPTHSATPISANTIHSTHWPHTILHG